MKQTDWKIRLRNVRRVLVQVMVMNILVALAKLVVGLLTNTLSMVADGVHSLLDSLSNVVGLVGVTAGARPPDSNHPYGHHKIETLTSLVIGAVVIYTAIEIIQESVARLIHQQHPHITFLNIVVMIVTMVINVFVTAYERRAARRYNSDILHADSLQTQSDIFVSGGVLLALALAWSGATIFDPIAALAVTAAIFYSAWLIFKRATRVLTDETDIEPEQIESAALGVEGVLSVEKIRSRGTEKRRSVDLHIRVDPEITLRKAHEITHDVQRAVEESTGATDVIIHTEPQTSEPAEPLGQKTR
ncbi:MAG: cation transporter [Armatimonadetes bacterium]|nr:cation transporter [Armatimonadota bacterium]